MADFNGALQKLNRAKAHLNALDADLNAEGGPYRLTVEPDAERGYYLVKAIRVRETNDWALLLGDFLHNVRSALDHMVWQLVLANDERPSRSNEFPIAVDPGWFDRKAKRYLAGVHDDAIAVIRSLQPFRVSDEGKRKLDPLWLLNELENVDKHRLVHVLSLAPQGATLFFDPRFPLTLGESLEVFDLSNRVLEHGTKLARIRLHRQPQMEVNSEFHLLVLLEKTELTPRLEWGVAGVMVKAVEDVMAALTPFVAWPPSKRP